MKELLAPLKLRIYKDNTAAYSKSNITENQKYRLFGRLPAHSTVPNFIRCYSYSIPLGLLAKRNIQ